MVEHTEYNLKQDIYLENESVLLRPLQDNDFDHLLKYAMDEPELWKYALLPATGEQGLRHYLEQAITARKEGKEYPFIVFDKTKQTFAGSTRYYDIQLQNSCLQLGYTWYGREFQGTGLNKKCKFLLLEFAFEQMKMERVEFRADYANERSIAAMKSIGCTVEGVLRSNGYRPDGTRRDSIILSILQKEWFDSVKGNLARKIAG